MAKLSPDYIEWVLKLNASDAQKEIHDLTEKNKTLKESNRDLKKAMAELTAQGKAGSAEWQNLSKQVTANNKAMGDNNQKIAECEKRLDKTTMTANQLQKKMSAVKRELRDTVKSLEPEKYRALSKELEQLQSSYDKVSKESAGFWATLKKTASIGYVCKTIVASLGFQFATSFKNALSTIIDFEKANSVLAAILGTTADNIKDLTDEARRLGATTSYTASEVTQLQTELAKLGFAKDSIIAMTPAVLTFAKAVGTDLAGAASLAGSALRIFKLDAEDMDRAVSTMAIGTTNSALNFEYLQNSLSTVGPVAAAFGFTIEDTTALLGALANSGFDASSAATATRNILLGLADSGGDLAIALGGPVKTLDDLMLGLQKLNAEGIDLNKSLQLTDKRSVAAFQTFLTGAKSVTALRDSVTGAEGAFNDMSDTMGNNVAGSLAILQSTVEGVILQFYEGKGVIKGIVDTVTVLVEILGWVIDKLSALSGLIITGLSTFGAYNVALALSNTYHKLLAKSAIELAAAQTTTTAAFSGSRMATLAYSVVLNLLKFQAAEWRHWPILWS